VIPSVAAYDPAFSYEVATIVEDGIRRMSGEEPEDRVWYLTLYNENYTMPPLPADPTEAERVRLGTIRGMYRFDPDGGAGADDGGAGAPSRAAGRPGATLLFSGSAWQAATEARRLLAADWGVNADLWSVTSYKSLREEAMSVERWNRLHPGGTPRVPYVTDCLAGGTGPVVAVTDFLRAVPDQVARWMPRPFTSLGTDGFGRSDTREVLRRFFEVDAAHIVVAALHGLAADQAIPEDSVAGAMDRYGIDPAASDPWST
jgi:pyruvate dehydrogenase E1 component